MLLAEDLLLLLTDDETGRLVGRASMWTSRWAVRGWSS